LGVIRLFFVMSGIMTKKGAAMSNKPTGNTKESAVISATVRANEMLIEVCGPRGWNDTRESWLARGARAIGIKPRRARALFYQEPIKLSADEYLAIARAWESAHASMASISHMAREADVRAHSADGTGSGAAAAEGGRADAKAR
jgi:hypothetical protein